jgi:glyoxylase-like metal-dependent hydrolase (beta-lactamase superfamily II)
MVAVAGPRGAMVKKQLLTFVILGFASAYGQDNGRAILQKAIIAMGAGNLNSIQFSGSGKAASLGQSYLPNTPWPTLIVKSYTRTIDYPTQSSREEMVRTLEEPPVKGGGAPFAGEQKQVNIISGLYAWNQPGDAPQPNPTAMEERQLQIVSTPHGFLKQALISTTAAKKVKGGTEVSYNMLGRFKVAGMINGQGMVEKIETWLPSPVLGDMPMETTFSDYKDYLGVKFPTHIVQNQGGSMVLDLNINSVVPNAPNAAITAPDAVKSFRAPAVVAQSEKLADGVWFIGGGSHNSVVLEGKDFITVVEAPLSEERSLAVIAEAKKLVPGKPIRYLVNTHHHFDHSSGIRTYVAEGATIVTSEVNKDYYEQAWKAPRMLVPDNLSRNPKKATFVTVKDSYTLDDGNRKLELHLTQGDNHNGAILFGYLPKEKILIEADDFTPPPPNGTIVPLAKTFGNGLYDNIQRLKLDIQTIAPLHGRVVPYAEMPKALGRS